MIWTGGCHIIRTVAVDAINAQGFKAKQGSIFVAKGTISSIMWAYQWKPAALMHFSDIFDNPRLWGMTPAAVGPQGLVMDIRMAIHA